MGQPLQQMADHLQEEEAQAFIQQTDDDLFQDAGDQPPHNAGADPENDAVSVATTAHTYRSDGSVASHRSQFTNVTAMSAEIERLGEEVANLQQQNQALEQRPVPPPVIIYQAAQQERKHHGGLGGKVGRGLAKIGRW